VLLPIPWPRPRKIPEKAWRSEVDWWILAQTSDSAVGDLPNFVQYGVLGLVIVAFLIGWIWPKPPVDRLIKDKEAAEAQRDALVKTYEEQVIPAIQAMNSQILPALTDLATALRDLKDQVAALQLQQASRRGSDGP